MIGTDIGGSIVTELALEFASITAGAGNDNAAVTGRTIDLQGLGQIYASAKLSLLWKTSVNTSETLTLVLMKLVQSASSNMASPSDYGTQIANTVIKTGLATAVYGRTEISFDLRNAQRYVRPTVTVDLSRSGTDTVLLGAVMTFAGAPIAPVS